MSIKAKFQCEVIDTVNNRVSLKFLSLEKEKKEGDKEVPDPVKDGGRLELFVNLNDPKDFFKQNKTYSVTIDEDDSNGEGEGAIRRPPRREEGKFGGKAYDDKELGKAKETGNKPA